MHTVSAALIVKNEEAFLPGCLASLAGKVDEIIVVDTGSTDKTREIAIQSGAKVIDFPWRQDFAAARNTGLDAVTSDWTLYIDADERLVLPLGMRLNAFLPDKRAVAARLLFRPTLRGTRCREFRLFQNRPDIRFVGAIHETIIPDLERLKKQEQAMVADVEAELIHLGYEGDLTHKYRRNLPMLHRMVQDWPERLYYWLDLARSLRGLGETAEARRVCQDGLNIARTKSTAPARSVAAQIAWNYAILLLDGKENAKPVIEEGLQFDPGNPSLLFQLARAHISDGRYNEAIAILDHLRSRDPDDFLGSLTSFDERIFGAHALELKSVALLRSGRRTEAAECLREASMLEPDDKSYRIKALAMAARP